MNGNKNRIAMLGVAVIILLFMGLIYAWSIFVGPLEAEFGWARTQTSLTFSISMMGFSMGGLAAGYIQKRTSPRAVTIIGSLCICIGFISCSHMNALWQLFVFYGILCGVGVGLCYNVWLGVTLANFPDKTGFASGWMLMGFGLGGFVLGKLCAFMIYSDIGWRRTFLILGILVIVLSILALPLLKLPDCAEKNTAAFSSNTDLRPIQMIKTKYFWFYLFWCWILLGLGLAVVGQAALFSVDVGATPSFAATAVGLLSIGNGVSRVILGSIFDKLGRKSASYIATALTFAGVLLLTAGYALNTLPAVIIALFLCGFGYGAISTVNPASVRKLFGGTFFQQNFGMMFVMSSPAIFIGNSVSGAVKAATGTYLPFLYGALVFAVAGFVLLTLMERTLSKNRIKSEKYKSADQISSAEWNENKY